MRPRRYRRGNRGRPRKVDTQQNGFNEAAAISPRKQGYGQLHRPRPELASMRPRRYRRGNLKPEGNAHESPHRFNEAAAISPRKPVEEGAHGGGLYRLQ